MSNETEATKVWFDDLHVTHTQNLVTQATDYGPWGDIVREQRTNVLNEYRYAYQGQYAEKDLETGWEHFELREYDPMVGKWTVTDPKGQYASPYIGMGNNPVGSTDKDGGWVKGAGLWNNLFKSDSRIHAEHCASTWKSDITDYVAIKAGDAWGVLAIDKVWVDNGRQRYSSFTPVKSDGSFGAVDGAFEKWAPATGQVDFDPLTQLTLGFVAVNGVVSAGSKLLSVGTAPGKSLFWSGMRASSASEFAAANGFSTLEMTSAGRFLSATQGAVLPFFRNSLWRSMSGRFASKVSGDVFMYSGYSVRTGSVWMEVERQILMNNSSITGMHYITGF